MAEDNNNNESYDAAGARRLPRGMGDGKTNAQVFGIIGQQVKRIGDLNKSVASGMADVQDEIQLMHLTLAEESLSTNNLLSTIGEGIMDLIKLTEPITAQALESAEDQYTPGMAASTVGASSAEVLAVGDDMDKTSDKVEKTTSAFSKLGAVLGMGGGGVMAGRAVGGAIGGGVGGTIMGVLGGVGIGLGAVGVGLGLITGALYIGAKAVEKFGQGLQEVSIGMAELNKLEINKQKFYDLGDALGGLVEDIGLGGGLGLMMVASTDMEKLAVGMKALNDVDIDKQALIDAGEGLGSFLDAVGIKMLEGFTVQIIDDNLIPLAEGVNHFNKIDVPEDFVGMMERIGLGLGVLLDESGGFMGLKVLKTGAVQAIDDNLDVLASGISSFNDVELRSDFLAHMKKMGLGLKTFIDHAHSFGVLGEVAFLQVIDDNLEPLAKGIQIMSETDADAFHRKAPKIGQGLNKLIDGMDNIAGVFGANVLDDELMEELPKAINELNKTDAELFQRKGTELGEGFGNLIAGFESFFGTRGLQRISDDLNNLASGINDLTEVNVDGLEEKFASMGKGISSILQGVTGEINETGEGFDLDIFGFGKMMDTASSTRGLERISGPLMDLANAMEVMSKVSEQGIQFDSVAQQLTMLLTSVNDKALGDDFDYLYDFTEEIRRLQRTVDIGKLERIADQVERLRGDGTIDFVPNQNNQAQQTVQGAINNEVNNVVNQESSTAIGGDTNISTAVSTTQAKFIAPVQPTVFISK